MLVLKMTNQWLVLKIHSSRLRKAQWKLTLSLQDAQANDEIVTLGDRQIFRFMDEMRGVPNRQERIDRLRKELRWIKKQPTTVSSKKEISQMYEELDALQFRPDYLLLVIDSANDYWRAAKGFTINGVSYSRLLGTNGGVKNSTIVFVNSDMVEELRKRIENGRKKDKPLVPAKLEAYQALVCSGSVPVSMPKGVAVVDDCVTNFTANVVYLNDEADGEPVMETRNGESIELDESDGYGMMCPALAERWSYELGLDYTTSGVNTRYSFEKGMVFTFDYHEFAQEVAGKSVVLDAWGNEVDLRETELVLTTSMVKLWDSYDSVEDYIANSTTNGYSFCVTKICPEELEKERHLNYQFIQSYDLNDEDVEELITPTVQEIKDILALDYRKTILFLKGTHLNEKNVCQVESNYAKALMIDPRVINDKFVRKNVTDLIKKKITDAKVGVLKVDGNFSVISGDPYALCQSMFGLPVTGLLKEGQIYNQFWADRDADKLACFRAPMTSHANIRKVSVADSPTIRHWYQYMKTNTVLNAWDTACMALNGADKDGDLVMLTNNRVLVDNLQEQPALMCAQRKAEKIVPTEKDMIQANINAFGDDIGKITNRITSMFCVRAQFPKGSEEYETLSYRINEGQLFQQNSIDKAKGIIAKPMPKEWYDKHSISDMGNQKKRKLYSKIVANKKPYFMKYIYPTLAGQYSAFCDAAGKKALWQFGMDLESLESKPEEKLTQDEKRFLFYYNEKFPVNAAPCVMNRICWRIEDELDGFIGKCPPPDALDYSIYKSGVPYTSRQYYEIKKICLDYLDELHRAARQERMKKSDASEISDIHFNMLSTAQRKCEKICPNEKQLCDIIIDIFYTREGTKKFVWETCSNVMLQNLLEKNGGAISYPEVDEDGDIVFQGERFSLQTAFIGGVTADDNLE